MAVDPEGLAMRAVSEAYDHMLAVVGAGYVPSRRAFPGASEVDTVEPPPSSAAPAPASSSSTADAVVPAASAPPPSAAQRRGGRARRVSVVTPMFGGQESSRPASTASTADRGGRDGSPAPPAVDADESDGEDNAADVGPATSPGRPVSKAQLLVEEEIQVNRLHKELKRKVCSARTAGAFRTAG